MNEPFILPVVFQEKGYEFKARFERYGYTHRVAVLIDDQTYSFEPDEEGGYRALAFSGQSNSQFTKDASLLAAIAVKLANLATD